MNESSIVSLNGVLTRADEVRVSPFDLGYSVGLGLFETMPSYQGEVFALRRHYCRMERGIGLLGMSSARFPSFDEVRGRIHDVLEANRLTAGLARVRMSLSGGGNPLGGGDAPGDLIISAVVRQAPTPVASLTVSQHAINEASAVAGIKSASYADHVGVFREALAHGADESVRVNTAGDLCECAMSNLFLVKGGCVLTPPLESGCLGGVTRSIVIELCEELGITCLVRPLPRAELGEADELFITSSIREVQAAVLLESGGAPGPVTLRLKEAYQDRITEELS